MDLGEASYPNYFSLDNIIATHVRVPCKTTVVLTNFGFMEPSLHSEDLPANCQIDLPLWAARVMSDKKYVTAKIPKMYKDSYREALQADPGVVDLNKMGPHFYQSGLFLSSLHQEEAEEVGNCLPSVLQSRLHSMADSYSYFTTHKSADRETLTNLGSLMKETHMDVLEHRLFEDSKKSFESLLSWLDKK